MSALDELLDNNNWKIDEADIRHDIDIYMWGLITPPPVQEGRLELAQLRKELDIAIAWHEGDRSPHALLEQELAQLRAELAEARALVGRFANQGVPQAMSWMKEHSESEK